MKKEHWAANQIGDFPYHRLRRRRTDRSPNIVALICWLFMMLTSVIGMVWIVGEVAKELR